MALPVQQDADGNIIGQLPMFMTAEEILTSHMLPSHGDDYDDVVLALNVRDEMKPPIIRGKDTVLKAYRDDPKTVLPVTFE